MSTTPRRLRLALGLVAAVVLLGALVAPVVLTAGTGSRGARCEPTLRFRGHLYGRRPTPSRAPLQRLAIGVGVLSGCGQTPQNVDVRSLAGRPPGRAVGLDGDTGVYERR